MILLRDLPGVIDIEELCRDPGNFERDEVRIENHEKVDRVSVKLFGIIADDTYSHWPDEGDPDLEDQAFKEAEAHYDICNWEYVGQAVTAWNLLGWDLAGKNGDELLCAEHFNRQIVAAQKQMFEGAKFYPDGDGARPDFLKSADEKRREQEIAEFTIEHAAIEFMKGRPG